MSSWKREAGRWFRQAEYDLQEAERCLRSGSYAYACFCFYLSPEKAARAIYYLKGEPTYRHDVAVLLEGLKKRGIRIDDLVESGVYLNKFYAPTRYPNLHPSIEKAPFELYSEDNTKAALSTRLKY